MDPDQTHGLPVLGLIAAGQPITTLDEPKETLQVPHFMIKSEHSYVLEVQGESMIEDGILSGDYIVVRANKTPQNGDMVVALVGGDSATLKRFYREKSRIRLQPDNANFEPMYFDAKNEPEIQGVVTGVIRKF